MVPLSTLLLPIVLSAVFVFIVSSIIHMILPYHKNDYRKLPDETGAADALRPLNIPPGEYALPRPDSMKEMKSTAYLEKVKQGPVMHLTVLKNGPQSMGVPLILWFVFILVISVFAAYVSGRALGADAHYLSVFRFTGVSAFLAYGIGALPASIWYGRAWSTTIKNAFDGLIYAFVTAGTFGWLWP